MRRQRNNGRGDTSTPRPRRIACRRCRQAKSRCELSSSGTAPCSRCRQLGKECEVDRAYKPVNNRVNIEELRDEIRQLRSSMSTKTSPTSPLHPDSDSALTSQPIYLTTPPSVHPGTTIIDEFPLTSTVPVSSPANSRTTLSNISANIPALEPSCTSSQSLEHVTISPRDIDALFSKYFAHYHDYVPLVDPEISPNEYYVRSPLLFWAVIYISSRRYDENPSLFVSLASPVKSLLWQTISNPPFTCYIVQGILLLCMWPFPSCSMSTDNSLVLVRIAQTSAMRLGLHRPDTIQDYSRTKRRLTALERLEAVKTWAVCYWAGQSITSMEDQPLGTLTDWMIDRICDRESQYTVPDAIKHQVIISRFLARLNHFMSGNRSSPTGLPPSGESTSILALLDQELVDMSNEIKHGLSAHGKVLLDGASLQLYVYYLLDNSGADARKRGLLKAFNIATTLIFKLRDLDTANGIMLHAPATYYRLTCIAATVILKINCSSYSQYVDLESGKRAFNVALVLIRRASVEDNDLPGRATKILAQLWSTQEQSQRSDEEPSLKLKTRSGASVIHDALWAWRERFGGQASRHQTPMQRVEVPPGRDVFEGTGAIDIDGFDLQDLFDIGMFSMFPSNLESDLVSGP